MFDPRHPPSGICVPRHFEHFQNAAYIVDSDKGVSGVYSKAVSV